MGNNKKSQTKFDIHTNKHMNRVNKFFSKFRSSKSPYYMDSASFTSTSTYTETDPPIVKPEINKSISTITKLEEEEETVCLGVETEISETKPNPELRYSGQCLTPDQLPEFCEQLHTLLDIVRNVESYGHVTGEYPSKLQRKLKREADALVAMLAEANNAREAVRCAKIQRRALREHAMAVLDDIGTLRDEEMRELETTLRNTDRQLYKTWETVRSATDNTSLTPVLEDVKNQQQALEILSKLVTNKMLALRCAPAANAICSNSSVAKNTPGTTSDSARSRYYARKQSFKRRRKEREAARTASEPQNYNDTERPRQNSGALQRINVNFPMNPLSIPYELVNQSGIPAHMLPSMGSNSNHNLNFSFGPSTNQNGPNTPPANQNSINSRINSYHTNTAVFTFGNSNVNSNNNSTTPTAARFRFEIPNNTPEAQENLNVDLHLTEHSE